MDKFLERYGPWALITGASSGIGAEFGRQLAAKGLNLLLVARRKDRLEQLAQGLRSEHKVDVRVAAADLSRDDFLADVQAASDGLEIGMLVNNAGFGWTGEFLDHEIGREIEMLHLNCRAALVLAHAYGRPMRERRRGGIVFVSSVLGHMPTPYMTNYAATKAYDLFLGEGLWYELKPHGVDVITLSPGQTRTEFHEVAGAPDLGGMPVAPVVAAALEKIGRAPSVIAGWQNRAVTFVHGQLPRRAKVSILGRVMRSRGRAKT